MSRVAALILALLALDTGAWVFACARLEDGVRRVPLQGWTLAAGTPHWAGWPFAAEVWFAPAAVHAETGVFPPGLRWSAEALRLRIGLVQPTTLLATAEGQQTIEAQGMPAVPFKGRRLQAVIDLNGRNPIQVSFAQLEAALPAGSLRIGAAEFQFQPDGVAGEASSIVLPGGPGRAVLPPVDVLQVDAAATRPFPLAATAEESARAWREQGGSIEITRLALRWGALAAAGRASIRLDEQLQPGAEGSIEASGLPQFLDTLVQAGALPGSAAVAAKAVLAILAAPSGGGAVRLPVALHGGVLSVARYPLLLVPPLAWE